MPIVHVPIPSIPPNFVYVKTLLIVQQTPFQKELYSDHFFQSNTSLTSFNVITAAATDFLPGWFRHVFTTIRTDDNVNIAYQFFANVGTHVQSVLISPSWPLAGNGASLGPMFKCRVSRRASSGVDYFWGRFTYPPIPKSFVDGNKLNTTGRNAYDLVQIAYMQPWFSQGLTFTPCGWSRRHNTTYPLEELRRMDLVTFDRKSRFKDAAHSFVYRWPTVL